MPLRAGALAAAVEGNPPIEIIFDAGNPDASVGVIGEEVLEVGAWYENLQVIAFEPDAIILKEEEAEDTLKWLKEGAISTKALARARRFFVVKQLRAIDGAQHQYLAKFHDRYAADITTLINQGFFISIH